MLNDNYFNHMKIIVGDVISHMPICVVRPLLLVCSDRVMFMLYAIYLYVISVFLR